MLRRSALAIALAPVFAHSFNSLAADTTLSDIVVTAARTEQKVSDALGDISVITQDQIQKAGQTSLVQLLAMQPGVEIVQNGGTGKSSDVFIRGANATHTVVLVDGLRVNSATTGTTALENIPLDQIEHVEILRGPASSLYGADAIGGVIQIFTKTGKGKPRLNASVGLGTYGSSSATAGIAGRIENTSFSMQAGASSTNGVSAIANKTLATYNSDDDGYSNRNVSLKLAQHFSENHELGIQGWLNEGTNHYDGGNITPLANPRNRFDFYGNRRQNLVSVYSKNQFTDNWLSHFSVGQSEDNLESFSPNTANTLKVRSLFKTTQTQYAWQNDLTTPVGLFNLGTERREQKVEGTTTFAKDERHIQSYLAGWQYKLGSHQFQANTRLDQNSQFGDKTTGSLAYGYQINAEWRAHASYGTAFSAPTFNQLYSPLQFGFSGNAKLKPEEAENRELGLQYTHGNHRLGAIYYKNNVDDLIVNTRVGTVLTPLNVNEAELKGLTLSYNGSWDRTQVYGNADFQRAEDADTGNWLPRRAREHGTLGLTQTWGDWQFGSEVEGSGHRFDDAANTQRLRGYTLVNVFTNYRINQDWSLNARVNNLFDREYELAQNYGTFGTNLFVTLRYSPAL
ncbi:TonB-dependent receptor domain-containing protein [Methylovorus mays]|uniref:TonB-dependent receptor domain-containing protein n=1 Tax=Methylovorus mays TaxID=184077 RepID=UPI001E289F72|nr:TonB-dependent receptor [Methylovorus mays]MCB5207139.1 TonB-dependent receptor [Methylovorus mays]